MKKRLAIIICMIISVSMFVSACGIFGAKKYPDPQETLDELLTALSEGDSEAASELLGDDIDFDMYDDGDEKTVEYMPTYFDQMTIEVNGEPEYKGSKADLSVTVVAPDLITSFDAVVESENSEFMLPSLKDLLLASLNGADTTEIEIDLYNALMDELNSQMADPENKVTTESTMKMSLNEDGDGWIIDEISGDFINPEADGVDSDEIAAAVQKAMVDAFPEALDLLLEEGSIDQATYDALKAAL